MAIYISFSSVLSREDQPIIGQMVAYWKCSDSYTDLRLDYKYNAHAMATASALLNLSIAVPVDGGVLNMQSQPTGTW